MPALLRGIIRPLQFCFGKTKEQCGADLLTNFFTLEKGKLAIVDQNGGVGGSGGKGSLTAMHTKEAKESVFNYFNECLAKFV